MNCLLDAHNHLQDEAFGGRQDELMRQAAEAGVVRMVVNGATEEDWPHVLELAQRFPSAAIPSFGLHPRYITHRTSRWRETLINFLDLIPSAVGEIGLDRLVHGYDFDDQVEVFLWQLELAAERDLPVTIHCLRAYGRLFDLLRSTRKPDRGFLLHSYGGSPELLKEFLKMGAYVSISGQFAQDWKTRQRETFRHMPANRLLIETDAPYMLPAERCITHTLLDCRSNEPVNHPANLAAIYAFVAALRNEPVDELALRVRENFQCFFGPLSRLATEPHRPAPLPEQSS
jgi:TatD DNase family protein